MEMEEIDPETVGQFLEYLYATNYTLGSHANGSIQHARVYVAADRYLHPELKDCALAGYVTSLDALTDSIEISDTIKEVYQVLSGFSELTKPLIEHLQPLLYDLMSSEKFEELLSTIPDAWKDMLRAFSKPKDGPDLTPRFCNFHKCRAMRNVSLQVACTSELAYNQSAVRLPPKIRGTEQNVLT